MVDEFRAAFQELIDASVATDPQQFPPAVHKVYLLASQIPASERELALEALTPLLSGDHAAPGIIADLSVVAGALVEMGTDPGPAGIETLHSLRTMGKGAIVFVRAWERTGGGPPPDPDAVTADAEARVAAELGPDAPAATMCWWTIRRHGLAARTMLGEPGVRAHTRGDPSLHADLAAIANQLSDLLAEFDEVRALLRMAEASSALVMDRTSGRAFRVLFDGISDNFQLHTLLADALIGPRGQGLPGEAPDPRWTASFRDGPVDPAAQTVWGWWNLVAHDGAWVWNEGVPAEIPTIDGEHVLVLDEQPYPRSWNAGRRLPHVRGWLEVDSELDAEDAALWWNRVAPAEPAIPDPDAQDHTPLPEPVVLHTPAAEAQRVRGFVPRAEPDDRDQPAGTTPDGHGPGAAPNAAAPEGIPGRVGTAPGHDSTGLPATGPGNGADGTNQNAGLADALPDEAAQESVPWEPVPADQDLPAVTEQRGSGAPTPLTHQGEHGGPTNAPTFAGSAEEDTAPAVEEPNPTAPAPTGQGERASAPGAPSTTAPTGLPRMPRGVSQSSGWGPAWR
ncbi:hypothetical protein [Nocardiopsis sp. B62]|uniref:hypothetical protein n=1 Tax=Nocardiopsis sp. B62 TaxID=2824874 RepID=UPI001B3751D3|nr:hypothetical protein [Nocardiopsis sp. B62]MBQ1079783.1 hypothetical protein [Nocardiopsis sp. B62]